MMNSLDMALWSISYHANRLMDLRIAQLADPQNSTIALMILLNESELEDAEALRDRLLRDQ